MAAMTIPSDVMEELRRRAAKRGVKPQTLAVEILRKGLLPKRRRRPRPKTERERVHEVLRASGLVRPLSPELRRLIIPGVSHAEVRHSLRAAGGKPLSEIIIEQRGPKV